MCICENETWVVGDSNILEMLAMRMRELHAGVKLG